MSRACRFRKLNGPAFASPALGVPKRKMWLILPAVCSWSIRQRWTQKIALEWPAYGYRTIAAELRKRGFEVNHKRVLRMLRQDNLLCVRRRKIRSHDRLAPQPADLSESGREN
jgi:transposase InsO family protein